MVGLWLGSLGLRGEFRASPQRTDLCLEIRMLIQVILKVYPVTLLAVWAHKCSNPGGKGLEESAFG